MTKLETLIKLNNLEKQNRRSRLEDKLKQQEYYGEIKELFDPVTKILNLNNEELQALQNQAFAALEDNTNTLKSVEHQRQRQSRFLDNLRSSFTDQASPISPEKLKDDRSKTFDVDNDMIEILVLMGKQTKKLFELISVDPNSNKFKVNGVDVSLVPDGIKMKCKVYDFSKCFALFITRKEVTERDIKDDENKI